MLFLTSAWAAFKGSKTLEYIAGGFAVLTAGGAAVLALLSKGKAEGTAAAEVATLKIDNHNTEEANAAAATARADGAIDRLHAGTF